MNPLTKINIEHALIDLKDVIIEKSDHNRKLGLKDCISKEIKRSKMII